LPLPAGKDVLEPHCALALSVAGVSPSLTPLSKTN
jgi:hypothetical protein